MLRQTNFREATELRARGAAEIALPDDDARAMLVALSVVHGRLARVPPALPLPLLVAIAVIVDKYGLHEALGLHTTVWLDALTPKPQQLQDQQQPKQQQQQQQQQLHKAVLGGAHAADFLQWLCVAWVFCRRNEFRALSQLAQREWDGPLHVGRQRNLDKPESFPVPATILGTRNPLLCSLSSYLPTSL
jgi:hypothetical protein